MALSDIIRMIETLNEEGIKLTRSSLPNRYDLAFEKHFKAAKIAESKNINPDYYAVSAANMAYALRFRDNDGRKVLCLLEEALEKIDEDKSKKSNMDESYFGTARILEEKGLVIRDDNERTVETLKEGLVVIEECLYLYDRALENSRKEIVKEKVIRNRLARTLGIASTIASEIASRNGSKAFNECALYYSGQEMIIRRIKNRETKGYDLMNAYHTNGAITTEMISRKTKMMSGKTKFCFNLYSFNAHVGLTNAQELAESPLVKSVLKLRFGWLEYKENPSHTRVIKRYVDAVLSDQDTDAAKWPANVKSALKDKMFALGKHLGKDYKERIQNMYRA